MKLKQNKFINNLGWCVAVVLGFCFLSETVAASRGQQPILEWYGGGSDLQRKLLIQKPNGSWIALIDLLHPHQAP